MKKFLSISLLFLYLVSSIGIIISLHYCGGSLASLSLSQNASCCCDDNVKDMKEGCCKDEVKFIKITDDQNKAEYLVKKFSSLVMDLPAQQHYFFNSKLIDRSLSLLPVALARPPDRCNLIPAYKRNHSFLFYS